MHVHGNPRHFSCLLDEDMMRRVPWHQSATSKYPPLGAMLLVVFLFFLQSLAPP